MLKKDLWQCNNRDLNKIILKIYNKNKWYKCKFNNSKNYYNNPNYKNNNSNKNYNNNNNNSNNNII